VLIRLKLKYFINMENINEYRNRFYTLLESEMGDVKPLLSEQAELNSEENVIKFQTWVKQTYPSFDLGNTGINQDGIDGKKGGKTNIAWSKFGKQYLSSQASNDNSMAKTGKEFVDATKQTLSRMIDSGDFDYSFIENRMTDTEAAKLFEDIVNKESNEFFYILPEAVVEAIFIRIKNGGCQFFVDFMNRYDYDLWNTYVKFEEKTKTTIIEFKPLIEHLKMVLTNVLDIDINKKYHKESIASILSFLENNCKRNMKLPV